MPPSILWVIVVATLASSQAAMAFNCSGITLPSSLIICSDPDLMRLADERQQIYNETRSRLTPDQQSALWEDQKAWVRSYAAACGAAPDNPPPDPAPPSMIMCFKRAAEARAAYLRGYGPPGGAPGTPVPQPVSTSADGDEIALVQAGSLFEIPVRINGAISLNFIIDSGASNVQIPFDVFSTLVRANTIQESDIKGEQIFVLADGSEKKAPKFLIRELKIGHYVLHNVQGNVSPLTGSLLLGQSFLSHFDSWTLDNKRHVLRLVGKISESGDESAASGNRDYPVSPMTSPALPRIELPLGKRALVCGKSVDYAIYQSGGSTNLAGVWTGNWNNPGRLCGALIIQGIDPRGTVDIIYVYGPSRPGTGLVWKQQHRVGVLNNDILSFRDDQGSTFRFRIGGPNELDALFQSQTGRLTATFQRLY